MLAPMHVLVIPGLTMRELADADRERILDAAGPDATITVAESYGEALEAAGDADGIFGRIDPQLCAAAKQLRWGHAITAGAAGYLAAEMRDSGGMVAGAAGRGGRLEREARARLCLLVRGRHAPLCERTPFVSLQSAIETDQLDRKW